MRRGSALSLFQTYGPFTRNHPQPEWARMTLEERAKFMARQGQAYATADEARVVYTDSGDQLRDVPADGQTVGEIVVRGNIVMKEVGACYDAYMQSVTRGIVLSRRRGDKESVPGWPLLVR
jgi:uncharacterized protein YfaQ (DUF2300 family)